MIENPKKAPSRPLYLDEKSGKPTRYNVYLEDLAEAISGSRDIPHMMRYLTDKGYEVDFSGGHWKMKLPQYKHFTRLDTLDERLTPDFIRSHLGTRARYGNYKARKRPAAAVYSSALKVRTAIISFACSRSRMSWSTPK